MKRLRLILLVLLGMALIGCTTGAPQKPASSGQLTILHTNDHHGHFWKNGNGEYGLAAQKTAIDRIRQEVAAKGGQVLVLSAGDINMGVPESDLQDAEPDFLGMSKIGYDAMALGNHEFDKPREVLLKQAQWASFPFLSANIYVKASGQTLYDAYKIFHLGGMKVAVFGLSTEDTPLLTTPAHTADLEFKDAIAVAKQLVPELNSKADVVVALSHLGYNDKGYSGANTSDDLTLAKTVPEIDVIVGGHTHTLLKQPTVENGVIIVQGQDWGKYLGRLDLVIENGKVTQHTYRLIPINLKKKVEQDGKSVRVFIDTEIPEDPEMLALLTPFQEKGAAELGKVIGSSDGELQGERDLVRTRETNLGNLVALTQRLKVNADLAIMNSGGIRTGIAAGEITYKDVLKVQPFANTICRVTLTGAELKRYLETVANMKPGSGAFPQFNNVRLVMNGERLESAVVNGVEVNDTASYTLALNGFMAGGGDGYPKLSDHPSFVDTGYIDADVMREYIANHSPLRVETYAPTGAVVRK